MRPGIDEQFGRKFEVLCLPRQPAAAVDEHVDRRVRLFRAMNIELLVLVGHPLGARRGCASLCDAYRAWICFAIGA